MTSSYWLSEERPSLPEPEHRPAGPVDVAIVGGGVTGCACALALAEAGQRVVLYEAREIAGGASGRNGGFALRGGAPAYDRARRDLGPERAKGLWRWTERYLDRLEELAGDAFRRTGSLRLAADPAERAELEAEYEALREDGFAAEWRDELPDPLRGRFDGAIFHPPDGSLQPARWVRRLAARAAEAGAELREHHRVESIDELEADHVVLATDGYTQGLLPELDAAVHSDSRPGARDRAAGAAPVPLPALRQARLRLLAADAGGPRRRGRLPGQGARPRAHLGRGGDAVHPGPPRAVRDRATGRAAADRVPLGRHLRRDRGPPPARRPRPRPRPRLGLLWLLGPRQRHGPRVRRAGRAGRSSAGRHPSSSSSSRPGCIAV